MSGNQGLKRIKLGKNVIIPESAIMSDAPCNIELHGEWFELIIPIGKDHSMRVLIDDEALRALHSKEPEVAIF